MDDILVSIITVCYNSEKTIERTIRSVLNQSYQNIEYLIVDGLSEDHTIDIARKYEYQFNGRLRIISERDNGIYDAMNKGIRNAHGQLIGIINSDDYYEENAVESMVEAMGDGEYQILYGFLRKTVNGLVTQVIMTMHENLKNVMIPHPTCFITKKVYSDFGMYDLNYRSCADYEFMLRMISNREVEFCPVYRIISTFEEGTGMSSKIKSKLEVLMMKKKYGLISLKQYNIEKIKLYMQSCVKRFRIGLHNH